MKLTHQNVEKICHECMENNAEGTFVVVEGIIHSFAFNKDRIEQHSMEITDMLLELPDDFIRTKGQGASFLVACNDKYGHQWTGDHLIMEKLFALGSAINKVKCLFPKEMWHVLPGRMPYYVVINEK